MRFHVVGQPYLPTKKEFSACAFTQKNFKFCKMMKQRGHTIFHYGVEGSNAECDKDSVIVSDAERKRWFGEYDRNKVGYAEKGVSWDPSLPYWKESNAKANVAIAENAQRGDFICLIGGTCQQGIGTLPLPSGLIADIPLGKKCITVEYGAGYLGTFADFVVYESYAHMHHIYGRSETKDPDGRFFDAVIPSYFDLNDFTVSQYPEQSDPYYLFVGRMIHRKGVGIAVEATRRAGVKLVLCGQGARQEGNKVICDDGSTYEGDHLWYVGHAGPGQRDELMRRAVALFAPSIYLEPFGSVAVESQLCGTPVITTDFGAMTETVPHGIAGYRCRTLEQFVWAIQNVHKLDRQQIAGRARSLYSLERIGLMYDEWFSMLSTLWGQGWYSERQRTSLNWMEGF
jgi:glycosyltransferase involved in cell wall biosynthesis